MDELDSSAFPNIVDHRMIDFATLQFTTFYCDKPLYLYFVAINYHYHYCYAKFYA